MYTKVVIPSMPNQEKKTYDMAILMANIVEKLRNFDSCYCCLSPDNTAASSSLAYQSVNLRIFL